MGNRFLEESYQKFLKDGEHILTPDNVDYLGVNIDTLPRENYVVKAYYVPTEGAEAGHPLADYLKEKGMLRYFSAVQENQGGGRNRVEIGIKNRLDSNMSQLLGWLREQAPAYRRYEEQIRYLAQMKITEREDYQFASFYFIGSIGQGDKIDVLKMHFLTRMCEDPERSYRNPEYRDEFYLEYLARSGIKELEWLVPLARTALACCGGHLFIIGLDCGEGYPAKYKIYLKQPDRLYAGLREALEETPYRDRLIPRIRAVESWNCMHPELESAGVALCLDQAGVFSVNFYY